MLIRICSWDVWFLSKIKESSKLFQKTLEILKRKKYIYTPSSLPGFRPAVAQPFLSLSRLTWPAGLLLLSSPPARQRAGPASHNERSKLFLFVSSPPVADNLTPPVSGFPFLLPPRELSIKGSRYLPYLTEQD
jgi:hypothetical protein